MLGRIIKSWVPLAVWMTIIFTASTGMGASSNTSRFVEPFCRWLFPNIPPETLDAVHFFVRKAAHMTEYGILAILIWRVQRGEPKLSKASIQRQFWRTVLFAALYASTDEFHQLFSGGREAQIKDVCIDTLGALGGSLVFLGSLRLFHKKK